MYLAVSTRPDIAFAVNNLAQFNSKPQKEHWTALKRILRYLKGTTNICILYKRDACGPDKCVGYSDADWAGDTSDRKSTSCYIFMLSGGPISWSSKNQVSSTFHCRGRVCCVIWGCPRMLVVETIGTRIRMPS